MSDGKKVKIGDAFRPSSDYSLRAQRPIGGSKPVDKPVIIGRPIIKPKQAGPSGSPKPKGR